MWNSSEWAAIAKAAPGVQRPVLQTALRELRTGTGDLHDDDFEGRSWIRLRTVLSYLHGIRYTGATVFPANKNCGEFLEAAANDLKQHSGGIIDNPKLVDSLKDVHSRIDLLIERKRSESRGCLLWTFCCT